VSTRNNPINWLDHKYVQIIGGRCRNFKRITDTVWNFSCPICGDSEKHLRKARGYVTEKHGRPRYTCHKCGYHKPLHVFIREVDARLYAEYTVERVTAGFWKPNRWRIANPAVVDSISKPEVNPVRPHASGDPLSPLSRVDTLKEDHRARVYCEGRKIPDLTRLYHCPRFYAWSNWVLKTEKFKDKAVKYFDHPRLIIPFIVDGKLTCFQGRDYRPDSDAKYITIRVDEEVPKVFGFDEVDETETVYAVEGPIDSLFLPNCVSFVGGDHSILNDLGFDRENTVIVYDNEPRAPHTKKKIERAIRDKYRVCIWPTYVVEKDPNDMVLAGLDPFEIIKKHTYYGLQAELELKKWRPG
jgi:predicted RNA-binding Zn-ribbon protein involved in translation (DUF1610 family)